MSAVRFCLVLAHSDEGRKIRRTISHFYQANKSRTIYLEEQKLMRVSLLNFVDAHSRDVIRNVTTSFIEMLGIGGPFKRGQNFFFNGLTDLTTTGEINLVVLENGTTVIENMPVAHIGCFRLGMPCLRKGFPPGRTGSCYDNFYAVINGH